MASCETKCWFSWRTNDVHAFFECLRNHSRIIMKVHHFVLTRDSHELKTKVHLQSLPAKNRVVAVVESNSVLVDVGE
jgi:hypothetical protein